MNFIEDTEFLLTRRDKKQRLSLDEKILIYKAVKFQKQRAIDAARKFGVSIGTVYSILRNLAVCRPNFIFWSWSNIEEDFEFTMNI